VNVELTSIWKETVLGSIQGITQWRGWGYY